MADSSITGLPAADPVDGTEVLPIDQDGTTSKVAIADLTPGLDEMEGDAGSGGTKGLVPAPEAGDAAADKFLHADGTWAVPAGGGGGGTVGGSVCCGRLTLESGVAVSTTDQTAKTTIYFTPFRGNQIALYDGSAWSTFSFSEVSIALGTLTSGKNYDVFAYNNAGTVALEFSAAWSSDTARTDAITLQDGVYVKSADTTRRYLGTFRTTSTTTTEDSAGGTTTQVGGKRFLWNYYNRVARPVSVFDSTSSHTYSTATWRQYNSAAGNQFEYVTGLSEDAFQVHANSKAQSSVTSNNVAAGIGIDSTTANSAQFFGAGVLGAGCPVPASYSGLQQLGYHYVAWLQYASASGTTTWYGDVVTPFRSGMIATVMG